MRGGGMASGGHNKKTRAQAEREGTARADRHVEPVRIAPGAPPKPSSLSNVASEMWDELVPDLAAARLLERVDAAALEQLVEAWSVARRARELVGESPVVEVTRYSQSGDEWIELKKNPALGPWKDAVATLRSLLQEFGLTPMARQRMGDALREPGDRGPKLPDGAPPMYVPPQAV